VAAGFLRSQVWTSFPGASYSISNSACCHRMSTGIGRGCNLESGPLAYAHAYGRFYFGGCYKRRGVFRRTKTSSDDRDAWYAASKPVSIGRERADTRLGSSSTVRGVRVWVKARHVTIVDVALAQDYVPSGGGMSIAAMDPKKHRERRLRMSEGQRISVGIMGHVNRPHARLMMRHLRACGSDAAFPR